MNASFATYAYQYDERGNIIVGDRTEWSYGRFGRFQGYSGSFSYTLNNDTWKKWFGPKDEKEDKGSKDKTEGEYDDEYISEEEQEELKRKQSQPRKKEKASISNIGRSAGISQKNLY